MNINNDIVEQRASKKKKIPLWLHDSVVQIDCLIISEYDIILFLWLLFCVFLLCVLSVENIKTIYNVTIVIVMKIISGQIKICNGFYSMMIWLMSKCLKNYDQNQWLWIKIHIHIWIIYFPIINLSVVVVLVVHHIIHLQAIIVHHQCQIH